MNSANLIVNANTSQDLEKRLAAQGVLKSTRVYCNDLQDLATMGMDAQVDQLVVEFEQQLKKDSDIIEVNFIRSQVAKKSCFASLKAASIVASSVVKQQPLLVSFELDAKALNVPQHKLHHLLLSTQAQGADFVTVSQITDISVAKRLVIASQTVDVPVALSLDHQGLQTQGVCALELGQALYKAGASAVGVHGYIGPQNTDNSSAHSWLADKRGSLYIH